MIAILLAGCAEHPADHGPGPVEPGEDFAPCASPTAHRYDPLASVELEQWPDALWTRDDPTSPTGVRLDVTDAPWAVALPALVASLPADLASRSGFSTVGDAVLRFTGPLGPVPSGAVDSTATDALLWLDLDATPPTRVPYEAFVEDGGRQLRLRPLRPLAPGRAHAIIATDTLLDAEGRCIAPSAAEVALLTGDAPDPRFEPMVPAVSAAIEAAGVAPSNVSAVSVFGTHRDHEALITAAAALPEPSGWHAGAQCSESAMVYCEIAFTALDPGAGEARTLRVSAFLPRGEGPWPALVYGHGLDSWRTEAWLFAERIVPEGFAVVAVDAMHHYEHPSGSEGALGFLGLDLDALTFDPSEMRRSLDQTALDEVQLVRQILAATDLTGDGVPDVDPDAVGYVGMSLGGLLGPSLLALEPALDVGVLGMPGGHLAAFVTSFGEADILALVEVLFGGEDELQRILPVLQTAVDASDPAMWGARLAEGRAEGAPDLLLAVAAEDAVVPAVAGRALALALDVPHLAPVVEPIEGLEVVEAPWTGGPDERTWAFLQLDRVSSGSTSVPADHYNVGPSFEMEVSVQHFLETWRAGGAEAIDPYAALGTPPL
jgi:dienelactone hydrolase